jgi:hypothetical protein
MYHRISLETSSTSLLKVFGAPPILVETYSRIRHFRQSLSVSFHTVGGSLPLFCHSSHNLSLTSVLEAYPGNLRQET